MTEMPLEDIGLLIPKEAQNEKKPTCHSFVELFFAQTREKKEEDNTGKREK